MPTACSASRSAATAASWSIRRFPIAPIAGAGRRKPAPLSGRGTIVGFTVNSHRWLPDFNPPYVIANVALTEDPRVHLTTNIVGCEPADVQIGQEVAVRFLQQEDVWLPLFELTGELDPIDRVPEPVRPLPARLLAKSASSTAPSSAVSADPRSAGG